MTNFPCIHQRLKPGNRFADGNALFAITVLVAQPAKKVGSAFRPVQLVEINDVGLQALEAAFHGFLQAGSGKARAATDMFDIVAGARGLGCSTMTLLRWPVLANHSPMMVSVRKDVSGLAGTAYISAVSKKLIPCSSAISIWAWPSSAVFWLPQVMVPRQRALTFKVGASQTAVLHGWLLF